MGCIQTNNKSKGIYKQLLKNILFESNEIIYFPIKMQNYVIMIHSREYNSWNFLTADTYAPVDIDPDRCCDPAKHKLFSRDIISWPDGPNPEPSLHYSPTRNQQIAAVLQLDNNQTYGRHGKRLLYRCVPNDRFLPTFLVPYAPKIEFHKKQENKFVIIQFDEWTGTHPIAKLEQVLGNTSHLPAFYDYQLHSRSLMTNDRFAEFNKATTHATQTATKLNDFEQTIMHNSEYFLSDFTQMDEPIFTIDPRGSNDYDDAFSAIRDPVNPNKVRVSVYISSVYVLLNHFNLWSSFSKRVSTIYLPDYRRPMIPSNLSEQLCSLKSDGQTKYVVQWEVVIDTHTKQFVGETFRHAAVRIAKNYHYDSPVLQDDIGYSLLQEVTRHITNTKSNMDSHDVVSYWMIQMNRVIGKRLATKYKTGIFRKAGYNDAQKKHDSAHNEMHNIEDEDTRRVVNGWKNSTGVYCRFSETDDTVHEFLNAEYYTHITSPIRRIVDLLNQMMFLTCEIGIKLNEEARTFLTHWTTDTKIEYINATMRSIRKVQMDCDTVSKCYAHPEWMQHEHKGIVFDRIQKTDSTFSYMVYLQNKIISRVNTLKWFENYTIHDFVLTISPIDHVIRVGVSRIC